MRLPCGEVGCKECWIEHFAAQEERGVDVSSFHILPSLTWDLAIGPKLTLPFTQPICPICQTRLSSQELQDVTRGISSKKILPSKRKKEVTKKDAPIFKKAKYTTSTSGPSSDAGARSSSQSTGTEILTILDTSDEESEDEAPVVVKKKGGASGKGKGKASSKDDDSDSEYEPDGADRKMGDLDSSDGDNDDDDDNDKPVKKSGKRGLVGVGGEFQSSTKLDALIKSLEEARLEDPNVKVVVFSQFTGFCEAHISLLRLLCCCVLRHS